MNKLIDLTHLMEEDMPVYPGTKSPQFSPTGSFKVDGYRELLLTIQSHTGTHIDVPAHIFENGKTLSEYPPSKFCGRAFVIPLSKEKPLTKEEVHRHFDILEKVDFLLFQTGWDKHWGEKEYFENFPVLSKDVVESIARLNLKGIGIDAISIDPINSVGLPNHHIVLSKDIIIIENLKNLSDLAYNSFEFFCFPLHINKGDGSPVRAIARLME